jgi:SOS response regulatory protein OraA/RecX
MYNRRERRKIEKDLGILKLIKKGPKEVRDELLRQRKEEVQALIQQRNEEQETLRLAREADQYARSLQFLMEQGYNQKEAESILDERRQRDEERAAKKRAKQNK